MNLTEASKLIVKIQDELKNTEEGKEEIDGKMYTKVAKRVEVFRKHFGAFGRIKTDILHLENGSCVFKTTIELLREDKEGNVTVVELAYGHSRKSQSDSEFNRISFLEKTETGSIGRALANLGIGGDEFASMEEVAEAQAAFKAKAEGEKKQKEQKKAAKKDPMTRNQSIRIQRYKDDQKAKVLRVFEVVNLSDLTKDQADKAIKMIEQGIDPFEEPEIDNLNDAMLK